MILSLERCGGYMSFFFLWTAIQILEHTLLKRCAHAGPTAQARTLPTLLVCVCVFFFWCVPHHLFAMKAGFGFLHADLGLRT